MSQNIKKSDLMQILNEITDFRNKNLITYTISEVLVVVLIGVLIGLKCTLHIDEFARVHKEWFKVRLGLQDVPSHDTMDRILAFTDYRELDAALTVWLDTVLKNKHLNKLVKKRLCIDGKKTDIATFI